MIIRFNAKHWKGTGDRIFSHIPYKSLDFYHKPTYKDPRILERDHTSNFKELVYQRHLVTNVQQEYKPEPQTNRHGDRSNQAFRIWFNGIEIPKIIGLVNWLQTLS